MTLDYFATDRQSNARSFIFSPSVQSLEHGEDTISVLRFEPDAVVADGQLTTAIAVGAPCMQDARLDLHHRPDVRSVELQRVPEEILQQLPHLQRVGLDDRQLADVQDRKST